MHQIVIAPVGIDKDDLLEPVTGNLPADVIQQAHDKISINGDCAGAVPRLKNLRENIIRKDNGLFDLCGAAAQITANIHICTQRQMMRVPLND